MRDHGDTSVYEKLRLFLERFGEKGLLVLKAAYEVSQDPNIDHRLGDFSFKHLVLKLSSMGLVYNPINILRILEKEYKVVEKSYSSSNQTWWRFTDIEAVRIALSETYGFNLEDPRLRALLIKYKSMEPRSLLEALKRMVFKERLTASDKEVFKNFVFTELDKVVELLREMEKYEEVFPGEIAVLREILSLADIVSSKLEKPHRALSTQSTGALTNVSARDSFYENTTSYERDTGT